MKEKKEIEEKEKTPKDNENKDDLQSKKEELEKLLEAFEYLDGNNNFSPKEQFKRNLKINFFDILVNIVLKLLFSFSIIGLFKPFTYDSFSEIIYFILVFVGIDAIARYLFVYYLLEDHPYISIGFNLIFIFFILYFLDHSLPFAHFKDVGHLAHFGLMFTIFNLAAKYYMTKYYFLHKVKKMERKNKDA